MGPDHVGLCRQGKGFGFYRKHESHGRILSEKSTKIQSLFTEGHSRG